jgi:hypothetical protein
VFVECNGLFCEQIDFIARFCNTGDVVIKTVARNVTRILHRCAVLGLFVSLAGCAGMPSQEMSDARRAVDAAAQADASRTAPSAMQRATTSLDDANVALRAGQYEHARKLAERARSEAIAARKLSTELQQLKQAIDRARAQHRPWQEAQQLMQQALTISRAGDTSGALATAEQAATLLR